MDIHVMLFAAAAEAAGTRDLSFQVPDGATVGDLRDALAATYPKLQPLMPTAVCAVNESYEAPDRVLADGDEVAIIPPVSGGAA